MSDFLGLSAQGWPANLNAQKCTIGTAADGASEIIATQGRALVGLIMPASWTAAALQYYAAVSPSSSDLKAVKDAGTANLMQTLVTTNDWIAFPLADAIFAPFIQLRSVTAGGVAPVVQDAARDIILLFRNFLD